MRTNSVTGAAVGRSRAGSLVGIKDGATVGALGLTVRAILRATLSTRLANVIVLARLEYAPSVSI